MRKPVCVKCECDLKPERNGVWCVETVGQERRLYKVWHSDKWKCPSCGVEVLVGFGKNPILQEGEHNGIDIVEFVTNELVTKKELNEVVFTHEYWKNK